MHYRKSVFRSLALVTQLGLSVITPVFLCIFIGYQIDSRTGMKTMIPLLILGVLAGGRCAWQIVRGALKQERREDAQILQERLSRAGRAGVSKPKQPSRIRKDGPAAELEGMIGQTAGETQTAKEADDDGVAH
ncbi:MAG: AtpZ/AtpI family protein [Lachnospiraceae bacterium]|nr:AtpZ/AtpI family protein [Lachnospiraceae bacterium]